MADIKIDTSRPAPKGWRKFENAYVMLLAPAIIAMVQAWGLTDKMANRVTLMVTFSMAICKFTGFLIANGEQYAPAEKNEQS